ncbi:MAG: C4-type zinc ribbon domain-containing protein [Propionibacteriaceae bacterium]|nr:C4-type zinc ribbon domain-containing protein [Propionibacteriaceae bacterium]
MKAEPTELLRLLDLQGLDTAIEQVKHKASVLPVHQAIADLMKRRTQVGENLIQAKTVLSDLTVTAERAEADVVPVRERLARNQARVDAGEMEAKALSIALDEIVHLKQRVSDLEDAELEAMEAMDRATAQVGQLTESVDTIEQELREQVDARDAQVGELAGQARALGQTRAETAAQINTALVTLYDKIRTRSSGIGVTRFQGRRCGGCGLEATVADYNTYMNAAPDEVIRCAECDRILVR